MEQENIDLKLSKAMFSTNKPSPVKVAKTQNSYENILWNTALSNRDCFLDILRFMNLRRK